MILSKTVSGNKSGFYEWAPVALHGSDNLEQLLVRSSGMSSWPCFSTGCFSPMCGLTDLLSGKHRQPLDHEDWQMESHRRLLVVSPRKFFCPLEKASLQGSFTLHAALGTACSCASSLPGAQKPPHCFRVNKWVCFCFLYLIFRILEHSKLLNCGCAASLMCWIGTDGDRTPGGSDLTGAQNPGGTDEPLKTYF